MRIRSYPQSNYKAVFFNGKTIRMKHDSSLGFKVTPTPEIEDVAINSKCYANCSYCYTSATKEGTNFTDIVTKAHEVWGTLPRNERPFQIAIGGAGESTIHPDWIPFVREVSRMGIVPNYTTNGMHLSMEVLDATIMYCGGVAVSYHPHIKGIFVKAIDKLSSTGMVKLNVHIIVGDKQSFLDLQSIYEEYKNVVDYFVILPYQAAGRGVPLNTHQVWIETFNWIALKSEEEQQKFAFGALFYPFLQQNQVPLNMSIYEPELFSGYRIMDDSYKILRKSSYDTEEKVICI